MGGYMPVRPGERCRWCGRGVVVERYSERYGSFLGCSEWIAPDVGCQAAWDQFGNRLPGRGIDPAMWGQPGCRVPRRRSGCLLGLMLLVVCAVLAATALVITLT
jgi:hypothetical protein